MRAVTPNVIEQAKAMRAEHWSWRSTALKLDVSEWQLRCAIEPNFRAYRMEQKSQNPSQQKRKRQYINSAVHHRVSTHPPHGRPPANVLAERDHAKWLREQPRDITAELLGDPLPGRSALDQRQRK